MAEPCKGCGQYIGHAVGCDAHHRTRIVQLEAENSRLQAKVSALQATVAEQSNGLIDLRQLQRDIALERSAHDRTQAEAAATSDVLGKLAALDEKGRYNADG